MLCFGSGQQGSGHSIGLLAAGDFPAESLERAQQGPGQQGRPGRRPE